MRRFPLLLAAAAAALTVVPISTAVADATPNGEREAGCPAPQVTTGYDTTRFAVEATLLVSGCPAREHRWFPLTVFVSREDGSSGEGHGRMTMCGPFRSAAQRDAGDGPASYACDVDLAFDHPPVETARYDVEVTYPGAGGDKTLSRAFICVSPGATGACTEEAR
jgi:hypothetical protein